MPKTHRERAAEIIEELEADFENAEPELGLLIVELANERSRMSVRLIEAERACPLPTRTLGAVATFTLTGTAQLTRWVFGERSSATPSFKIYTTLAQVGSPRFLEV